MKVRIIRDRMTKHKMVARFYKNGVIIKTVRFGLQGYSDYTKHKDNNRKLRYLARHKSRENWNNPMTAGALSRWILWNKPTIAASIRDFKRRFNLD